MEDQAIPITATLRNWTVILNTYGCVVFGNVEGDVKKRFIDGKRMHTSQMTDFAENRDGFIFETLNSVYWLPRDESATDLSLVREALVKARKVAVEAFPGGKLPPSENNAPATF